MVMLPPGCLCVFALAPALWCSLVAAWPGAGLHDTACCHTSLTPMHTGWPEAQRADGRLTSALSAAMHLVLHATGYSACLISEVP